MVNHKIDKNSHYMCSKTTAAAAKTKDDTLSNDVSIINKYDWLRSSLHPTSLYEFKKLCRSNAPSLKANIARFNPVNRLIAEGAYGKRRNRLEVTPFIEQLAKKIEIEEWYGPYRTFHEILRFMFKTYGAFSNRKAILDISRQSKLTEEKLAVVERTLSQEALDGDAYKLYINNPHFPWNLTAHEVLKHKIASFCGHAATTFIVLAKALGFNNVRIVSSICNYDYNHAYCKNGRLAEPDKKVLSMSGHKLALAQIENGRWVLIDTSRFPIRIITTTFDGMPIYPETLAGKDILIEPMLKGGHPESALQRVVAVGRDENDDLHIVNGNFDKYVGMNGDYRDTTHHCLDYPLPELTGFQKK